MNVIIIASICCAIPFALLLYGCLLSVAKNKTKEEREAEDIAQEKYLRSL